MGSAWTFALQSADLVSAVAALALALWAARPRTVHAPVMRAGASAVLLTAGWALSSALLGSLHGASAALLKLADLAFVWTLYRLFGQDERDKNLAPIRPLVFSLLFVGLLQLILTGLRTAYHAEPSVTLALVPFAALLGLLFSIGALVLVHNLYAGASQQARATLRWLASGLAAMWLYDLNLATIAYLTGHRPLWLIELRGTAMLPVLAMLAMGLLRRPGAPRFQPSRQVAFQSFSLLAIGVYLTVMVLVVQALAYAGNLARVVQVGFLLAAAGAGLFVLPSPRRRGWVRVMLGKHLFQHRYDYRAEWLRLNDTIGRAGANARPLQERVVQALADITDSPAGLLLACREQGGLEVSARWQWPDAQIPAEAMSAVGSRFFEQSQFIVELDQVPPAGVEGIPAAASPKWLRTAAEAWVLVPLLHYERLIGLVVLARPPVERRLDWEDFDLLRVVGRQLASYLAEQSSQDALSEAQRFDEFNRRIAFVMHDIKNLVSQLSLLARNAERHAEKPEFRADMLVTLKNSSDKLQSLLARLGRYGGQAEALRPVDVSALLGTLAASFADAHPVIAIERPSCQVLADPERLEQALVHLVQNAIDASVQGTPVFLDLRLDQGAAVIEVVDSGSGMSADFVRSHLFKPFHSSKSGGFGIGAFEARELVRAMGGWLDVESREGLGSRFQLRLPLAGAAGLINSLHSNRPEVA